MRTSKSLLVVRLFVLIISIGCVLGIGIAQAAPAYPHPIKVKQPDGTTLTIRLHGDEFFHYTTTTDGYTVQQSSDGFYYYADFQSLQTKLSQVRAHDPGTRTYTEQSLLQTITKGVAPGVRAMRMNSSPMMHSIRPSLARTKAGQAEDVQPKRVLVILAEFKDLAFTKTATNFTNLLNQPGYSDNNGTGSARDYFKDQSKGLYQPTFVVAGPVKLPQTLDYYGKNEPQRDANARQLIADACVAAHNAGVNFADYDENGDGFVDNIFVYYAGHNEAEGGPINTIWPHRWGLNEPLTLDGKKIQMYACTSELSDAAGTRMCGVGTFCHEFGHVLGLSDMYDTDGPDDGGESLGLLNISIMCYGNYNNNGCTPPNYSAHERYQLGWIDLPLVSQGNYTLEPIHKSNKGYMIPTATEKEYFVVESRTNEGWDAFIGGNFQGLCIYHVDQSTQSAGSQTAITRWQTNKINNYPGHECMKLVSAAGSLSLNNPASVLYPGTKNNTAFSSTSSPKAVSWKGEPIFHPLKAITWNGTASTFTVAELGSSMKGAVVNQGKPIVGAVVRMTPVVTSKLTPALEYISLINTTKTPGVPSGTTNMTGNFNVLDIPNGEYTVTIAAYGYLPYATTITVNGLQQYDMGSVVLIKTDVAIQTAVSHCSGLLSALLSGGQGVAMKWSADMIQQRGMNGDPIKYLTWYTGATNANATAQIIFGTEVVYQQNFTTKPGLNVLPVTEALTVPSGKDLTLQFTLETVPREYFAALDYGPAVAGYGDLALVQGEWQSLKSVGFNSNVMAGYWKEKNDQVLAKPSAVLSYVGQRHIVASWASQDGNVEKWLVNITGNNFQKSFETTTTRNTIAELDPATSYQISITPVIGEKNGTPVVEQFATLPYTAPFSAMVVPAELIAGVRTYFQVTNLQSTPKKIRWTQDGSQILENGYEAAVTPVEGKQIIQITITYENGTVEVISRTIIAAKQE